MRAAGCAVRVRIKRVTTLAGAVLVVEEGMGMNQGIWRPIVMVCVRRIIFASASALLCDCVVARSQGDPDADADDVVVGNRKDAQVAIEEVAWQSKATCVDKA